jgi:hypothetical protein
MRGVGSREAGRDPAIGRRVACKASTFRPPSFPRKRESILVVVKQINMDSRFRGNDGWWRCVQPRGQQKWIPAFAGMTVDGVPLRGTGP